MSERCRYLLSLLDIVSLILFLFFLMLIYLLIRLAYTCQKNDELMEAKRMKEYVIREPDQVNRHYEVLRGLRHDYRNHINTIIILLKRGDTDEALTYAQGIHGWTEANMVFIDSGNKILDAVISPKRAVALQNGIQFESRIHLAGEFPFRDSDLSSLLCNLLDNAIGANKRLKDNQDRYIKLVIRSRLEMIVIYVENSYDGICYRNDQGFRTRKDGTGHGIGLQQVKKITEEAGGFCQYSTEGKIFRIMAVFPEKKEDKNVEITDCNCGG